MISRRLFSRLPVAAAAASAATAVAATRGSDESARRGAAVDSAGSLVQGPWNTLMTFDGTPPAPLPKSFWIYENFFPSGDYISVAALPSTTPAHGSWDMTDAGVIKTRSRLIVLPQLLGVAVKVEITESITLDWGRYTYVGTFSATFTPETGAAFTLTGKPAGSRIPPP